MGTPSSALPAGDLEALKAKLTYAWNVWEFHGRQRMNMFNYFLVIVGILINGYINAFKEKSLHSVLSIICLLGFLQCFVFLMIDWRNRTMLYFADDVLKELEKTLFTSSHNELLGPMSQRAAKEKKGLFFYSKMKIWIWLTYILVGIVFLAGLIYARCTQ